MNEQAQHTRRPAKPGSGPPKKQYFRRKRVCKFCVEKIDNINYKDVKLIGQFVAEEATVGMAVDTNQFENATHENAISGMSGN